MAGLDHTMLTFNIPTIPERFVPLSCRVCGEHIGSIPTNQIGLGWGYCRDHRPADPRLDGCPGTVIVGGNYIMLAADGSCYIPLVLGP